MKFKILALAAFCHSVLPFTIFAQDSASCQCQSLFDELTNKLKQDYIGYALRERELGKEVDARIREFQTQVNDTNVITCVARLQKFLTFFHDGHLFVSQMPKYSDVENERFKSELQKRRYEPGRIRQYLAMNRSALKDIEGVWTEGSTRYAIVRNENREWPYKFAAVVLDSPKPEKVGELKIGVDLVEGKYQGVYYTNGYSPRYVELAPEKENSLLGIWGGLLWGRVAFSDSTSISTAALYDPTRPTFSQLDTDAVLLTIPTFLVDKSILDSLLLNNAAALQSCSYLIIDIRGNSGGNGIYFDLMSLYADKPLTSEIGFALASQDNVTYFSRFAKNTADDPYQPVIDDMKRSMGQIVKGPRFSVFELPKTPSKVRKVAILTDRTNISAAETFVLHSKLASDKVVTIGTNTGGVVDYNNINMIKLGCERLGVYFGYPTFTLNDHILKDGYNGHGIPPDISSDKRSADLIAFALARLKQ